MPYDKELDRLDRENNNLRNKIEEQRKRIVYLEGATNHATGTPLSKAEARVAELEAIIAGAKEATDSAIHSLNENDLDGWELFLIQGRLGGAPANAVHPKSRKR